MKRTRIIAAGLLLVTTLSLVGCGSSHSAGITSKSLNSTTNEASYILGDSYSADYSMDYSSTYIDSSYADYSYSLYANGESSKSKDEMLKDYEDIQAFVKEKDGYIENVNNSYNIYDKDDRRYYSSSDYKISGTLSFTIQIDKDCVDETIQKLDQICKDNNLVVTVYNQRITNYEGKKIVDGYDDDWYDYDTISKEDLEKRLKYADINVQLNYHKSFNFFEKLFMNIGDALMEFWDSFGELVQVIIIILIILHVCFFNVCLWYKMFRKMMYKHKIKHPEFYEPKQVKLVENTIPRAKLKTTEVAEEENTTE